MKALRIYLVLAMLVAAVDTQTMAGETTKFLYDNSMQLEDKSGGSFAEAATWGKFEDFKECETRQIGASEYGLVLVGKKLDANNYRWIFTEKGNVIWVKLITRN